MEAKKASALGVPGVSHFQPDPRVPRTQLQFSWNAPASSGSLPDRYTSPRPIVIEKLKPVEGRRPSQDPSAGDRLDLESSMEFSVVSQEKLNRAVQLAKRDIKRKHLEEQVQKHLSVRGEGHIPSPRGKESGHAPVARAAKPLLRHRGPLGHPGKTEATGAQPKVYLYNPTQGKSQLPPPDSPPTHDPGPGPVLRKEEDRSTLEVRRLQKELQGYIQKVEELARKERGERTLDPDEERRVRIQRQEQAVRSNRMLYVLQQQVKEIQEDLDQLSPRKVKHTKKSRAMARLAAAHRGAVRALQTLVAHFARDQPLQLPPSSTLHIRQMGHLLRQLSLCSARLEMNTSVIPEVIMDLLLQIEDLDTLLAQQASPKPKPSCLLPLKGEALRGSEPKKPTASRKLLPDELPESAEISPQQEASGDGSISCGAWGVLPPFQAEAVMWQDGREASGLGKMAVRPGLDCGPTRRKGAVLSFPTRPQAGGRMLRAKGPQPLAKQARFQEPTVSFRLKEAKPPLQESRPPWVPPSLSSPLSSPQRRSEKGSKGKEPTLEKEAGGGGGGGGRQGPLKKEAPRADGGSPARIADKIEQAVRERLEPLLAKVQKVNLSLERDVSPNEPSGDNRLPAQEMEKAVAAAAATGVPEGGLEALAMGQQGVGLDPEALLALRSPLDLEAMLQRMEEMEHFQQDVRRRYHRVVYSDTELGAQGIRKSDMNLGATVGAPGAPPPPPPIQMTRLVSRREPRAEIVLERPLDADAMEEEEPPEPRGHGAGPLSMQHPPPQKKGATFLSVPPSILRGISDYGARFDHHLRGLSHEPVGSFNPWHIAQSLAEELTEEALADVAAELHDLCEDYAEAVFTSEFLQAPPE